MAKKNYQKITAYNSVIISSGPDKSRITIKGCNSKGTDIEITITVSDYLLPYMIKEMAAIGRQRVQSANSFNNRIITAVNQ
ncbi:MAG TPA: hypothetical protein VF487_20380 [Chitinophagaceae bacterium]